VTVVASGVLDLVRPRQWVKNVIVAAAPLAAGALTEPGVARDTAIAFVAFCLASSATYCVNDVLDADADARHPTKRRRPIPSGRVSRRTAVALGAVLAVAAVLVAQPGELRWVVLGYLALTLAYSTMLKHQPVVELGLVSGGFILRAIAGGAATGLPLSQWFLIVAGFGSLFMVTGKRLSELASIQDGDDAPVRRSLAHYPLSYLRMILGVSAAVTVTAYCLWAFETSAGRPGAVWTTVSTVPFVLALLRYALDADRAAVEEPEEVVLRDPTLLSLGVLWLVTFTLGVAL
jgi:decaprenyl-phosphate phosphoribosyltransferase